MNVADAVGQASTRTTGGVQTQSQEATRTVGIKGQQTDQEPTTEKERIQRRLDTFLGWRGAVSSLQLAVAGFIFTGKLDTVSCTFCGFTFYNWTSECKPLEVHRKYSPHCSFLKQWFVKESSLSVNQAKQEVKSIGYDASKAKFQTFVEFAKRFASFTGWPHKTEIHSPKNMAMAGFFYLGSSDRARCFYCGLVLRDWDVDDLPTSAHKQWSPNCAYIIHIANGELSKKEKVIDLSIHLPTQSAAQNNVLSSSRPAIVTSDSGVAAASALAAPEKASPLPSPVPQWNHSPAVQALLDWGYSLDCIQEGIRRHKRRTGKDITNAGELLCAVEEVENR